jgi:hypothetical protein
MLSRTGSPTQALDELDRGLILLQEHGAMTYLEAKALANLGRPTDALTILRRAAWFRLGGSILELSGSGFV